MRMSREQGGRVLVPNEDRHRHDALVANIADHFDPQTPIDLVPPSFDALHVPIDTRGHVNSKAHGFDVRLPSKLKRQNVKPLLRRVVYPYDHPAKEWFINSNTWDTTNWIHAAIALDPSQPTSRKTKFRPEEQRIFLRTSIKAYWEMVGEGDEALREVKLVLIIDCFIDPTKIFDASPSLDNDFVGLILHSTLPSPAPTSSHSDSERRADALRHFFSCLQPAPPVPYARSLQPSNMVSKLLPFQNRTVAWLLQRERHAMGTGELGSGQETGGFWSAYQLGPMGKVAYCRATGELIKLKTGPAAVPDRKGKGKMAEDPDEMGLVGADRQELSSLVDLSGIKGSMLSEEMGKFCKDNDACVADLSGLGKTVEAIALILLNRHPLSTKRDDAGLLEELEHEETTEKLGSTGSQAVPTSPERPGVRAAPKAERLRQSIIDLTKDLDLSRSKIMSDWWQREKEAFKDATIHDPIADLHVNQVAVCPLPLGLLVTS